MRLSPRSLNDWNDVHMHRSEVKHQFKNSRYKAHLFSMLHGVRLCNILNFIL